MVKTIVGWILIVWALLLGAGAIIAAQESGWDSGDTALWWVLIAVPFAGGVLLVGTSYLSSLGRRQDALENALLNFAAGHGGQVTSPDIARLTTLTLDQAEASLRYLLRRSYLSASVREDGAMIYSVPLAGRRPAEQSGDLSEAAVQAKLSLPEIAQRRQIAQFTVAALIGLCFVLSLFLSLAGPVIFRG